MTGLCLIQRTFPPCSVRGRARRQLREPRHAARPGGGHGHHDDAALLADQGDAVRLRLREPGSRRLHAVLLRADEPDREDLQLCRGAAPGQPEAADLREARARAVQDLLDHHYGHGLRGLR